MSSNKPVDQINLENDFIGIIGISYEMLLMWLFGFGLAVQVERLVYVMADLYLYQVSKWAQRNTTADGWAMVEYAFLDFYWNNSSAWTRVFGTIGYLDQLLFGPKI